MYVDSHAHRSTHAEKQPRSLVPRILSLLPCKPLLLLCQPPSSCCDEMPSRKITQGREKGVRLGSQFQGTAYGSTLAHSFRVQPILAGKTWRQGLEVLVTVASAGRKQRNGMILLSYLSPFSATQDLRPRNGAAYFGAVLPTPVDVIKTTPCKCARRPVPRASTTCQVDTRHYPLYLLNQNSIT